MMEIDKNYADALRNMIDSDTDVLGKDKITIINHRFKHESRTEIMRVDCDTKFIYLEKTKNGHYYTDFSIETVKEKIFQQIL